jgi:hypothetical protein
MDFLQRCELRHNSSRPQSGIRRLCVEDFDPSTQLQLVQLVRICPYYLVGHKEEGLEDSTLCYLRPLPCRVR